MITLDGDLDNRTYDFINGLGKSINIHNTTKFYTTKFYTAIFDTKKFGTKNSIKLNGPSGMATTTARIVRRRKQLW